MFLPLLKTALIVLLGAMLSGCGKSSRLTAADVAQRVFGGSEHMAAMSSASRATAYDIQSKPDGLWAADPVLAGYAQSEKVLLSDSQLTLIKQLLQQPASYDFDRSSLCIPHYDVLFVFRTQPHDLRVGLCFTCSQLAVLEGDHMVNKLDDFSPMRPKLLSLAKALFPTAPEIQRLQ